MKIREVICTPNCLARRIKSVHQMPIRFAARPLGIRSAGQVVQHLARPAPRTPRRAGSTRRWLGAVAARRIDPNAPASRRSGDHQRLRPGQDLRLHWGSGPEGGASGRGGRAAVSRSAPRLARRSAPPMEPPSRPRAGDTADGSPFRVIPPSGRSADGRPPAHCIPGRHSGGRALGALAARGADPARSCWPNHQHKGRPKANDDKQRRDEKAAAMDPYHRQ